VKIKFANLRIKGAKAYNSLTIEMNGRIHGDRLGPGLVHGDTFCTGDIYDQMESLREFIGAVLSLESDDGEIKAIDMDLEQFAPDVNP